MLMLSVQQTSATPLVLEEMLRIIAMTGEAKSLQCSKGCFHLADEVALVG